MDAVTDAPAIAMSFRHLQRILQQEPEFSSTAMSVDSPQRSQYLQQIKRRIADCATAQAHCETTKRVSQLDHRIHNEIVALGQQIQAVATIQTKQAQVTSTLQQAVATHDQGLHFVAAHTAHVANAVTQQCTSATVLHSGPYVEQEAPITTPERSIIPSTPVNTKLPPYDGSTDP